MKTANIKTPTAELLVVELPETGSTFDVLMALNSETEGYTLLGKPDEIREDVARELVKKMPFSFSDRYLDYTPYIYSPNHFKTAKESLLSLLESEIYWDVNPLSNEIHAPDIEEWHEAQEKTFDKNRSLIFVKN